MCGSETDLIDQVTSLWEKRFGAIEGATAEFDFSFTTYYEKEMGTQLRKKLVSFEPLVETARMVEIKAIASEDEALFLADSGGRRINIDPGFLSRHRLLLVSRKDSPHRIPVSTGIYGDLQLLFESGSFRPLEWTYPDYRIPEVIEFLNETRKRWLEKVRKKRIPPPGG